MVQGQNQLNGVRILDLGAVSYMRSQALYHAVAHRMRESSPDTIILCHPLEPYLCIGFHQKFYETLDTETCSELGLPILRRRVGGGLTYLNCQQLFYQCVFHHSRVPVLLNRIYETLLKAPVEVLKVLGLNSELCRVNEIEVNGRRIAGIGGGRIGEAAVVVGNLLIDFEYEVFSKVINVSEIFRQMASDAMKETITTLKLEGVQTNHEELLNLLIEAYASSLAREVYLSQPTNEESEEAERQAIVLESNEFLRQNESLDSANSLMKLKISGSTSIHQVKVQMDDQVLESVLQVKDGFVEKMSLLPLTDPHEIKIKSSEKIYQHADILVGMEYRAIV